MVYNLIIDDESYSGPFAGLPEFTTSQSLQPNFRVEVTLLPAVPKIPRLNVCALVAKSWPHLTYVLGQPGSQPGNSFFARGLSFSSQALDGFIHEQFSAAHYVSALKYERGVFVFTSAFPSDPVVTEAVVRRVVGFMAGALQHRQRMKTAKPLKWSTFDRLCKVGRVEPVRSAVDDDAEDAP